MKTLIVIMAVIIAYQTSLIIRSQSTATRALRQTDEAVALAEKMEKTALDAQEGWAECIGIRSMGI